MLPAVAGVLGATLLVRAVLTVYDAVAFPRIRHARRHACVTENINFENATFPALSRLKNFFKTCFRYVVTARARTKIIVRVEFPDHVTSKT